MVIIHTMWTNAVPIQSYKRKHAKGIAVVFSNSRIGKSYSILVKRGQSWHESSKDKGKVRLGGLVCWATKAENQEA